MICLRLPVLSLLPIIVFISVLVCFHDCYAVDARFELDPGQVVKSSKSATSYAKKRNRRVSHHGSGQSHKTAVVLQKQPADQNQPAAAFQAVTTTLETNNVPDIRQVRSFWDVVNPPKGDALQPLVFKSDNYELAVDPARYPLLKAADGGTLLLDSGGTLPPLVRTLIQGKDPSVRIVSASPADGRRFLAALLVSGGFYSVEEQPVMTFGTDPLLKVRADFKVERTAESVMRNEVILVSSSRQGFPAHLADYVKAQGFKLVEPFAERQSAPVPRRHQLVQLAPRNQYQTIDQLLEALSVPTEKNRRVQLFSAADSGIALSVVAERYFERAGRRYVVASFSGDPIAYTLFRLLETKGYRVVILEPKDTFKSIASKMLERMDLPSSYASHLLVSDPSGRYSLEMSGFLLENSSSGGGALMLTDLPLEQNVRELLTDQGYQIQNRQVGP